MKKTLHFLQIKDKDYKKENPYEMSMLGGKWLGHRFAHPDINGTSLRLEVFLNIPEEVEDYIESNIYDFYVGSRELIKNENEKKHYITKKFLWSENGFVGEYYIFKINNFLHVNVMSDHLKLSQKIVCEIMSHTQKIAIWYGAEVVRVNINMDKKHFPPKQDGVSVKINQNYCNYLIIFPVNISLLNGIAEEKFHVKKLQESKGVSTCARYPSREELEDMSDILFLKLNPLQTFTFSLRDENNRFMAAVIISQPSCLYDVVEIEYLYVAPELQGHKIGKKLLQLVELYTNSNNINNIIVGTMSYMVPKFYEKHGYTRLATNYYLGNRAIYECLYTKNINTKNESAPKLRPL